MDRDLVALLGFVRMFVFMAVRVPIGVAMGLTGILGFAALSGAGPALKLLGQVMDLPVNPNPGISCLAQVIKYRLILALAVSYERCQNHEATTPRKALDGINNLLHGLHGNLSSTVGAVGVTNPGKEQPEIIVDFGYRAHGRPWVSAGAFLVDRNCRAQPFNIVDLGLFHPAQELAGISR